MRRKLEKCTWERVQREYMGNQWIFPVVLFGSAPLPSICIEQQEEKKDLERTEDDEHTGCASLMG